MALLRIVIALAVASLAACYDPAVRDCTRSCSAATDCLGDQECAGGFCVAPGASCASGTDAGDDEDVVDARPVDARPIDAPPPMVELRIEVKGHGRVDTDQPGVSCDGPDGDCRFDLAKGTVVELTPVDRDQVFYRWRNDCEMQGVPCTLTMGPRHAKAEFTNQ